MVLIILYVSLVFGNNEPFYNYKYDKIYTIINNASIPVIDGKLNDSCWLNVEEITSFTQMEPNYNDSPTENTSVKIIQDEYAIYVSAQLYDKSSDLIAQKFVNRDDFAKLSMSDWFSISIDSQHDHQTGYEFITNSTGVQFDSFLFDDTDEEMNWDGAWESMVSMNDEGWSLEMRIPFSSLRFSDYKEILTWGINIKRYIHRKNEYIEWVVLPKGTIAGVSKFGHLQNIQNIQNETTIEVVPYISMGQMTYDDIHLRDPFRQSLLYPNPTIKNDTAFYYPRMGVDMKVHLSNNIILDLTTLPDFGQIESDPADINFTDYDTYFDEKRSFFLENITLFDTPIDLFHTRRIGENPNYDFNAPDDIKETKDALVLGAAKVTGKTESGISYGLVSARTMSQKRQKGSSNIFSIDLNQPTYNYFITRLTKDFLSGNSYMGIMTTTFKDDSRESSVISYDGMYNLFNNRLFIDSQLIYSMSDRNGSGGFLELEYTIPNFIQFGSNIEYYDKDLEINDIGYLIRNDLLKVNNSFTYHNDSLLLNYKIRSFSTGINHIFARNGSNLLLAHIFNPIISFNFNNYSYLDISYNLSLESYEDRVYDSQEGSFIDKIGRNPKTNNFVIDFGNDPTDRFYFDVSLSYANTEIEESGDGFSMIIGANLSEDSEMSVGYTNISGNEKYRFLEKVLEEQDMAPDRPHYIFSQSNNFNEKWIFRYNKFFKNGINLQLYQEYFVERHSYSNYTELSTNSEYPSQSDYILNNPFNETCSNIPSEDCVLDPNSFIFHYPEYNELNLNLILSWEYSKKSNIYFIYRFRKQVLGKKLDSFLQFIDYTYETGTLSEIWNDQSIYVKIDYWFDF